MLRESSYIGTETTLDQRGCNRGALFCPALVGASIYRVRWMDAMRLGTQSDWNAQGRRVYRVRTPLWR
jgi:hypothetical protein